MSIFSIIYFKEVVKSFFRRGFCYPLYVLYDEIPILSSEIEKFFTGVLFSPANYNGSIVLVVVRASA